MSTVDDLMALVEVATDAAYACATDSSVDAEVWPALATLRAAFESALQAAYERGRVAERALHVMAETTQSMERGREYNGTPKSDPDYEHSEAALREKAAEPVAWLLRPIVQRNTDRPLIRGIYAGPRTKEDYEFAALDGDEYVPLYASPPKRESLSEEQVMELVSAASLDWQRGFGVDVEVNRYISLVRLVERAHGIGDE